MNGTTNEEGKNEVESIVEHTREAKRLDTIDDHSGLTLYAVPDGVVLQSFDLRQTDPDRAKGSVTLADADSFMRYVNSHKMATSAIYCDSNFRNGETMFVAILNEHNGQDGDYRDLRALYKPTLTEEWQRWTKADKVAMDQMQFASFLEDNQRDIATVDGSPSGTDMLAMALSLEATQDARFKSSIRLASGGTNLEYVNTENEATVKRMQVFDRFALGIAPYLNGPAYQLTAKLRYRLSGGAAKFWFELIRPDLVIADAVRGEIDTIGKGTEIAPYFGKP